MSESAARPRRRRAVFLAFSALLALAIVVLARGIILPFVLAIVLAYVLTPLVAWSETKRVPRAAAVILVYVLVLGATFGFMAAITPRIGQEIRALRIEIPVLIKRVQEVELPKLSARLAQLLPQSESHAESDLEPDDDPAEPGAAARSGFEHDPHAAFTIQERAPGPGGESRGYSVEVTRPIVIKRDGDDAYVISPAGEERGLDLQRLFADGTKRTVDLARRNAFALLAFTREVLAQTWHAIFVFSITLMVAAYLMITRERVMGFFEGLVRPQNRPSYRALLVRIDRGLSGVVRGQLLICLVNGALSALGFAIIGLKFWPVLALVAMVLSIIPIFGALASSVPAVLFGLADGPATALFALLWIIGIHQVEANFLNPKIMGDAAKVHPVLVVFALLAGENLFHLWGALLAVPVLSILLSVFGHFRAELDAQDPDFAAEVPPPSDPPAKGLAPTSSPR